MRDWLKTKTAPSRIPFCANVVDARKADAPGRDSWYRGGHGIVGPIGAAVIQDVDDRRDQGGDGHRGGQGQVDDGVPA